MYVSSQSPYYDDYNETKKFYRILFRPGRAVQARELTQLQSILQKQIERFGSHIFKEGSIVIPGSQFYEKNYNYVRLQTTYNSIDADDVITDLEGQILKGLTNNVRAVVVKAVQSEASDPPTIYVKYLNSGTNGTTYAFEGNEILEQETDGTPIYVRAATTNATGLGTAFNIKSGVLFIKGVFAYFDDQTYVVSKYSKQSADQRIGFLITEDIINDQDDPTLLDPAVGTANYFAPGADRYKLDLTLESRGLTFDTAVDDTNFVELLRIQNNEVVFAKPKVEYNLLADELARRTFDESGDYTVIPNKIQLLEHLRSSNTVLDGYLTSAQGGDDGKYVVKVGPGKSYVRGYEVENVGNKYIVGDKARNYANVNSGTISVEVGNYVSINDIHSSPDILTLDQVKLYNRFVTSKGSAPSGALLVGNARVRAMEYTSGSVANSSTGVYSLYLFDVNMVTGYKFEDDVKSFYYDNAGFEDFTANIVPQKILISGSASTVNGSNTITGSGTLFASELSANNYVSIGNQLFQVSSISNSISFFATTNANATVSGEPIYLNKSTVFSSDRQSYIYEMPYRYIKTIDPEDTETTYSTKRVIDTNLSSGNITLTARTNEVFAPFSSDNYSLLIKQYGRYEDLTGKVTRGGTPTGRTVTIGLFANTNITSDAVRIVATVNKTNTAAVRKNKTLIVNQTIDYTSSNAATAVSISLGKADVFYVKSIKMSTTAFGTSYSDTNAVDITGRYTFDSGQRLQYYDVGRINLKSNQNKPTGPIRITFDYFSHSTSGDYFSADSYTDLDYKFIPTVVLNGKAYNLRDCLDFRPRIGDDSTFSSSSAILNEFVDQETDFTTDYQYYLPKIDKVVIDRQGNIYIVSGVSSSAPKEPTTPENTMPLFVLKQKPFVSNVGPDIDITEIDNKRYTMRDIGRIDNRVKNLEYYTSLNLLETQTATLQVQDSLGFDRFKNGFVVDNFSGHGIGDVSNNDYLIAVDYNKKELRPLTTTYLKTLREVNSSDAARSSNNYSRSTSIIIPKYTEELILGNNVASRTESINPFDVITFKGVLTLTPAVDVWFDNLELPFITDNPNGSYDNLSSLSQLRAKTEPYESVYGFWKDVNFGNERTETRNTTNENTSKTSVVRTTDLTLNSSGGSYEVIETIDTTSNNERIVSRNIIPKMRNKIINFSVKGMKPNTKLYAFFEDIDVTTATRISYDSANTIATVNNDFFANVSLSADLVTDQYGRLDGFFNYSAAAFKLPVGVKTFRLTDSIKNSDDKTTFAEALYTAGGQLVFKDKVLSTKPAKNDPKNKFVGDPGYPPEADDDTEVPQVSLISVTLTLAGAGSTYYLTDEHKSEFLMFLQDNGFTSDDQVQNLELSRVFNNQIIPSTYFYGDHFFNYYQALIDCDTNGLITLALQAGSGGADGLKFYEAVVDLVAYNISNEENAFALREMQRARDNPSLGLNTINKLVEANSCFSWAVNPYIKVMWALYGPEEGTRWNSFRNYHNTYFRNLGNSGSEFISHISRYIALDISFQVLNTLAIRNLYGLSRLPISDPIGVSSVLKDTSVKSTLTGNNIDAGQGGDGSGAAGAGTTSTVSGRISDLNRESRTTTTRSPGGG